MPKKTFTRAPKPKQPTTADIEAFERGGVGHDAKPEQAPARQPLVKQALPTKRLSLDLPESLHIRFKTACSATSRKMIGEIQNFIEQRTLELEEEAGLTRMDPTNK